MGGCRIIPQSEFSRELIYDYLSMSTPAGDRVLDWYCGLHARDESGKFTIPDPGTKKIADAVVSFHII